MSMKRRAILTDSGLLIQRVVFGMSMFLFHGLGKLSTALSGTNPWAGREGYLGLGTHVEFIMLALAEGVCSLLVVFGIGTRIFAIPLVIAMAVALFMAHADDPIPAERLGYLNVYEHVNEEGHEVIRSEAAEQDRVAGQMLAGLEAVEQAETEEAREQAIQRAVVPLRTGTGELALLFMGAFLMLAVAGGGRFSLDYFIWPVLRRRGESLKEARKKKKKQAKQDAKDAKKKG